MTSLLTCIVMFFYKLTTTNTVIADETWIPHDTTGGILLAHKPC